MNRMTVFAVGAAVAALVTIGATAVIAHDDDPVGMRPGHMSSSWNDDDGRHMNGAMTYDEESYLVEMVAHHEEAVDAARELARSDRPEMVAFGEAIIRDQSAQIEQMQGWLADWYPDAPPVDYVPMMRDLSGLSGDELDQAFLEDMVHHHMMAVMMSRQLERSGAEHDEVAELAESIEDTQSAEIQQMQRWLSEWFTS